MGRFFRLKNNLGSIYATLMLGRRPDQVKYVFMIGDRQDNLAEVERAAGHMKDPFGDPELEGLWAQRYHPPHYKIEDLAHLPDTTLGGVYARFMIERQLRPDFYKDVVARHKMHWLRLRLRQTHDIWHVLTGFDTGPFGEVGLQGFYFAQVTNGQSALIFAGAMLKSIVAGRFGDLDRFVAYFFEGYRAGRNARSLLAVGWESCWDEPIETLRQRHGIVPAPTAL